MNSQPIKPISPYYQWLATAGGIIFLGLAVLDAAQLLTPANVSETPPAMVVTKYFVPPTLEAEAALVYDLNRRTVIFEKNSDRPLPIASVAKVMTTLTAKRLLPGATVVPFNKKDWSLEKLIDYTLVSSSNQAAVAIATAAETTSGRQIIDDMNGLARELGLTNTIFKSVTGLDLSANEVGVVSSARDVTGLFEYILTVDPSLLEATRHHEFLVSALDGTEYLLTNTNLVANEIPGLLGSKTGFTDLAQGNLAIVFDRGLNQPVVVVVLASTETGRFSDIKNLIEATLKFFS